MQQLTLKTLYTTTTLLAMMLGAILSGHVADAANSTQMTLSPTKQRLDIHPNSRFDGTFKIYNSGTTKLDFNVYATPYTVKSDADYTPVFNEDKPRTQISRWITFDKKNYSIEPGTSADITYHVNVPASIPNGSQYATIFAETDAIDSQATSVMAKKRVGLLLYARATGTTIERSKIELSSVSNFQTNDHIVTTARIMNSGNTDFDAIVKTDAVPILFGSKPALQKSTRTVLPDSIREFTLDSKGFSPIGVYRITQSVTISGKTTSAETLVFVISPALLIVFIGIIIALIIWGVRRVRRKTSHRNSSH